MGNGIARPSNLPLFLFNSKETALVTKTKLVSCDNFELTFTSDSFSLGCCLGFVLSFEGGAAFAGFDVRPAEGKSFPVRVLYSAFKLRRALTAASTSSLKRN